MTETGVGFVNEATVLSGCLEWLAKNRIYAFRFNTGAVIVGKQLVRYGHPGGSDIFAFLDHRFRDPETRRSLAGVILAVETKSTYGRQTADQKLFEKCITRCGGIYLLVRSVQELKEKVSPYWGD